MESDAAALSQRRAPIAIIERRLIAHQITHRRSSIVISVFCVWKTSAAAYQSQQREFPITSAHGTAIDAIAC